MTACAGATHEILEWRNYHLTTDASLRSFEKDNQFSCLHVKPNGAAFQCNWEQKWFERIEPFIAIGACEDFMWGALFAGASAERAVRLAIEHTDGAGGNVQVEYLNQNVGDPGSIIEVTAAELRGWPRRRGVPGLMPA